MVIRLERSTTNLRLGWSASKDDLRKDIDRLRELEQRTARAAHPAQDDIDPGHALTRLDVDHRVDIHFGLEQAVQIRNLAAHQGFTPRLPLSVT